MIRISWIHRDTADEATRAIRCKRIEPRIGHRMSTSVSALGDKETPRCCCCPQGRRIGTSPPEGGHVSARSRRTPVICSACSQICGAGGANLDEITAVRVRARRRKLWAISFEKCLVARPVPSSPDALGTFENCSCAHRVGNNWSIKLCAFATGYDGTAGDDPL